MPITQLATLLKDIRPQLNAFDAQLNAFVSHYPRSYQQFFVKEGRDFHTEVLGNTGKLLAFLQNISDDEMAATVKQTLAAQLPAIITALKDEATLYKTPTEVTPEERAVCDRIIELLDQISANIPSSITHSNDKMTGQNKLKNG